MARALAVYTALRAVAFVGSYGLMILLGLRTIPAIVLALVLSALVSLVLLKPQRQALADAIAARLERREGERARLRRMLDDSRER